MRCSYRDATPRALATPQLIDGQQRLTSLVLLLSYLHDLAKAQGNEGLEGRLRRMLFVEADPLEPNSVGR
jgi:hypothetical protein